eukprot:9890165-Alexandrium_andersonii.AAC.1
MQPHLRSLKTDVLESSGKPGPLFNGDLPEDLSLVFDGPISLKAPKNAKNGVLATTIESDDAPMDFFMDGDQQGD